MNSNLYYNESFNIGNGIMPTFFKVGVYVRLSREDDDKAYSQSESIINQKESLVNFVLQNKWVLVDVYCDDGFSGTNFNRPDFKRMIADIEASKINMVVTKDMSRLGRDYIETGHYIERYFPLKNVRYIALNDGIDTFANSSSNDMGPFKTVMNDMYARDISKKVRFSMDGKRRAGKFIGSFAPFGYQKSSIDKNKLIMDNEAALIVKRIFNLYLSGEGIAKIASTLNKEGIITPSEYKKQKVSINYKHGTGKNFLWSHETIVKILENPTYAGNMTQNRYKKVNYKVKKLKTLDKSDWIIVNGTHEPIISQGDFDEVQRLREIKSSYYDGSSNRKEHLLAGLLFCGDCGQKMTFTKAQSNQKYFIICSRYKRFKQCTRHSIHEELLNSYVIDELKKMAEYAANMKELEGLAKKNKKKDSQEKVLTNELEKAANRKNEILRLIKLMYEDKLKGNLSEADFLTFMKEYNKEREQLELRLSEFEKKLELIKKNESSDNEVINLIHSIISFDKVNKVNISKLIDKILVYDKSNVVVHYKFKNPF